MAEVVNRTQWSGRVSALLIRTLTLIAVVLAAVGLYAVTAHGVRQHTQELGIRMALGARVSQLRHMILARAMTHTLIGLALGIACTAGWYRVFSDVDRGQHASLVDPWSLAAVGAVLVAVMLLACVIPVRQATRLDPAAVLRSE
jgi:ABC-type antimicrobial peptide transport system permease subunit